MVRTNVTKKEKKKKKGNQSTYAKNEQEGKKKKNGEQKTNQLVRERGRKKCIQKKKKKNQRRNFQKAPSRTPTRPEKGWWEWAHPCTLVAREDKSHKTLAENQANVKKKEGKIYGKTKGALRKSDKRSK